MIGAVPSESETVVSQLARTIFAGRGTLYLMLIGATTVILIMAANTAFADFPRLGALVASVTRLIPLYAIGVFLSFTLSQGGMALRWFKIGKLKPDEEKVERGSTLRFVKDWPVKMIVNGFGAVCTAVVMMVFAITKFQDGAWVVLILIPILVAAFWLIHRHYNNLAKKLSLDNFLLTPCATA